MGTVKFLIDDSDTTFMAVYEREWGGWLLPGSRGSVVSALDFQTLILSSIPVEVSLSVFSLQPKSSQGNNISF